jgi:hypothetical protein
MLFWETHVGTQHGSPPLFCHPEERLSAVARSAEADATKDLNHCVLVLNQKPSCHSERSKESLFRSPRFALVPWRFLEGRRNTRLRPVGCRRTAGGFLVLPSTQRSAQLTPRLNHPQNCVSRHHPNNVRRPILGVPYYRHLIHIRAHQPFQQPRQRLFG